MALDSYANLQAAIGAHLDRTDLASVIPDFITVAEVRFRRELRSWLRSTLTSNSVTADFAVTNLVSEIIMVSHGDGISGAQNFPMDLVSKETFQNLLQSQSAPTNSPGQACYVDYDASSPFTFLRFWPPATSTAPINLTVEVIMALPSLSATQTTNRLLTDGPDVYLYGSLVEAGSYLQHDERVPAWEQRVQAGIRELRIQTDRRAYGGQPRPVQFARTFG